MKDIAKKGIKSFFSFKPVRNLDTTLPTAILLTIGIYLTQIADLISTRVGLKAGAAEANPLMKTAVESPDVFLAVKLSAATLLAWFFWKRPAGALVIISLYLLIVLNNLLIIGKLV